MISTSRPAAGGSYNDGVRSERRFRQFRTAPNRQVISLSGDGGFSMLMGDFLKLSQHSLPVKVVVFNNGALGFVELEQKSTGFINTGTELLNPDFAAMANAVALGERTRHRQYHGLIAQPVVV